MLARFPHWDGPLWPLEPFQLTHVSSSLLDCTASQESYLHSHHCVSDLEVLHYHLFLSQVIRAASHTSPRPPRCPVTTLLNPMTTSCPPLILLDGANLFPLKTWLSTAVTAQSSLDILIEMSQRHFRWNILKTNHALFLYSNLFLSLPWLRRCHVSPASCVAGLRGNSSTGTVLPGAPTTPAPALTLAVMWPCEKILPNEWGGK